MRYRLKTTGLLLITLLASVSLWSSQDTPPLFQDGIDFTRLETPIADAPQVILVFRYGNESCYRLYRILSQHGYNLTLWPAVFRESWRAEAKLALMANQLGASEQQHLRLFETVRDQPLDGSELNSYRQLLKSIGLSEQAIEPVLFDSDLPKQLKKRQILLQKFSISAVPTIIFKGHYIITAEQAKTPARLLTILEYLESHKA
jgi:hypothetical protein